MGGSQRSIRRSRRSLRREGIARELVSQLQRLRRDLGFAVSDRIQVWIGAPDDVGMAIRRLQWLDRQ